MTIPLYILAAGAVFTGYLGVELKSGGESFLGIFKPHGYFHHYLADSTMVETWHASRSIWIAYVSAAVALAGRVHQRQIARRPGGQKAPLQRVRHGLRVARAHEAGAGHGPAGLDQLGGCGGGDDLHGMSSSCLFGLQRAVGKRGKLLN